MCTAWFGTKLQTRRMSLGVKLTSERSAAVRLQLRKSYWAFINLILYQLIKNTFDGNLTILKLNHEASSRCSDVTMKLCVRNFRVCRMPCRH